MLQIKDGHVFVINERERLTDIIERNSLFRLGTFIPYNFKHLTDVPIPSASIDLVVCYMGMHHLPQEEISIFLKMIYRILRPNGLFLFREHHAYEELIPLLDVAHMVFNAVTGVDYESEINEIRAFRTIEQWRSCLRQAGFEDTFIYDEQDDDPTDDIMIVFRKPIEENLNVHDNDLNEIVENGIYDRISAIPESNYFRPCEWFVVRICMEFGQYLNHTPFHKFPYMKFLSHYWSLFYIETDSVIKKFGIKAAMVASPGFIMNGFIGILLSISFMQMAFISFLILTFSGETKPEYEQLVLEQTAEIDNCNFNFQESIDHRISNVQVLKEKSCYAVRVPRHHVYTSILKKLALHRAKFNLLRISNLDGQIQIELTINNNDEQRLLWLKQYSNINVIFEYKNPTNITKTHLIIGVKIKYLFVFLRDCATFEDDHSLTIVQIFDHFDWYLPE
jgi:SAM-dependent methyltransferase